MRLTNSFFNRPADVVARELVGAMLSTKRRDGSIERLEIKETESYMGPHDLASHAAKGRTKRTEVMYAPAGTIYVYLIYGMYHMLNIVTGEKDYPAAVLIRGAGAYDGPGKLTKALGINMAYNGLILGTSAGIWIEDAKDPHPIQTTATPRIGVDYAGVWAKKKLRFVKKVQN